MRVVDGSQEWLFVHKYAIFMHTTFISPDLDRSACGQRNLGHFEGLFVGF